MTTSTIFALCGSGRPERLSLSRLGARVARRAGRSAAADAVSRVLAGRGMEEPLTAWQVVDLRMALVLVEVNATTLIGRPHSRAWIAGWTEVARAVSTEIESRRSHGVAPSVGEMLRAARGTGGQVPAPVIVPRPRDVRTATPAAVAPQTQEA
jgi:hypothetical protein